MKDSRLINKSLLIVSRREYFILLVCLVLSLGILFTNQNAQMNRMRAMIVDSWARVMKIFSWYRSMQSMEKELSRLRRRTTNLLLENSQLREMALENLRLRAMLEFKQKSPYQLVSARVIAKNQDRFSQYITLDVGQNRGVKKNMPLISPAGLVGKILAAGKETSLAQLLIDHNFRVACKVQRSRVDGILAYENGKSCMLTQVPKNSDVRPGDVVITSEYSSIFPPGILVGLVKKTNRQNPTLFMDIEITPAVDFSRLEEVFVVTSNIHPSPN